MKSKRQAVLAFARKLTVKLVFAAVLLSTSAMLIYANAVYSWDCDNGYCVFLSCGSTAGNYWAKCPPGGGPCEICNTTACQETADYQCGKKSSGGGPAPVESAN